VLAQRFLFVQSVQILYQLRTSYVPFFAHDSPHACIRFERPDLRLKIAQHHAKLCVLGGLVVQFQIERCYGFV
jgi:hypothetical protein